MKRGIFVLSGIVLGLMLISLASAADNNCVSATVTDISPSSIGINEEFTVGVVIENCGGAIPGLITFELIDVSPSITVKEALKKEITDFSYSNSERFLLYHMKTARDAKPGTYLLRYKLTYGNGEVFQTDYGSFSVTVTGEEAEMNIASVKTDPALPIEGDLIELTLRIENYGDGIANSVKVYADHPFKGTKESFIGTLDPDEDGPAVFTFITDNSGEFKFPVKISYKDDFGEHEIISNISVMILQKETNWTGIIGFVFIIGLFAWFGWHHFRTKREKDRIIQSLLKGKNSEEEKSLKHSKK